MYIKITVKNLYANVSLLRGKYGELRGEDCGHIAGT
jgi:hypothetical protein